MSHERDAIIRGADAMAMAIMRLVELGRLDSRSEAADAMINYAGVRCDVVGDEVNAFRKLVEQQQPAIIVGPSDMSAEALDAGACWERIPQPDVTRGESTK